MCTFQSQHFHETIRYIKLLRLKKNQIKITFYFFSMGMFLKFFLKSIKKIYPTFQFSVKTEDANNDGRTLSGLKNIRLFNFNNLFN